VDKSPFLYSDNYNSHGSACGIFEEASETGTGLCLFLQFSPITNTPTHQRISIIANIWLDQRFPRKIYVVCWQP